MEAFAHLFANVVNSSFKKSTMGKLTKESLNFLRNMCYKDLYKCLIKIREDVAIAEALQITDDQKFLDWEDSLNALSVKEHPEIKHPSLYERDLSKEEFRKVWDRCKKYLQELKKAKD